MKTPRDKYDYPGLPLRDRDGLPVGVGDWMKCIDCGAFVEIRVIEWEGVPGLCCPNVPKRVGPIIPSAIDRIRKHWSLVMPPGFPKDRRLFNAGNTFRFVDEWHGYWLDGVDKGVAEKSFKPCTDPKHWSFDGNGNPVDAEPEAAEVTPATQEEMIDGALVALENQAEEHTKLEERVQALEKEAEAARERVSGYGPEQRSELLRQAQAVQVDALPTDPAEWEPCEWDGETFPVYMRDVNVWRFDGPNRAVMVAGKEVGRVFYWMACRVSREWTPVRPKRREVEAVDCQCKNWCDNDQLHRMLTGHHRNCSHGGSVTTAAVKLIRELVHGIQSWGAEEDGIYPACWEPYKRGKSIIGEFDWVEDDGDPKPPTPDPLSDEALKEWFWENRERITITRIPDGYSLVILDIDTVGCGTTLTDAIQTLRKQVMETEKEGGAE